MPMIPPQALAMALESMPPELMSKIAMSQAGGFGGGGTGAVPAGDDRRARIGNAMTQAAESFQGAMEPPPPMATPVTGPQPPQSSPPGSVEGAMTQGPFPQRMSPDMERMQGGGSAFPMSQGFRGGFPKYGR